MEAVQDLVDRLVVATIEQDVLWVLVVLDRLTAVGSLEDGVNACHSWMGHTALESISQCPDLSTLRQLIAELLLLRGARKTLENESNKQLLELVVDWDHGGSERARKARDLVSMTMAAAADWIDEHLPIPPNVDNLTGGGPLPSRPGSPPPPIETSPTLALSPAETKSSFRASSSSEERSIEGVSPSTSDSSCSSRKKQRDASLGKPLVCLHLAPLPDRSTPETLVTLFTEIGVQVSSPRARERSASAARLFGSVDVAWSDAEYCIECLDLKPVADVTLRCLKARSVDRGLDPGTHPVPFNRTPHGGLTILEVTGVPLHLCVQDIRQLFAAIDVKALSVERARTDGDGGDTSNSVAPSDQSRPSGSSSGVLGLPAPIKATVPANACLARAIYLPTSPPSSS
ncbi:hypothetical protein JCM3766R1_001004 [Sporobolomyces carnicolor]